MAERKRHFSSWREKMHEIIFEADTAAGRTFDIVLLVSIVLSIGAVVLESVAEVRMRHGAALRIVEWIFTILFTVEYVARLVSVRRPLRYAVSFYGIVDLLAIVPTYLSFFFADAQMLIVIRALRLLRIFRVLKIVRYVKELGSLVQAIKATRVKITVFLMTVLTLVLILGSAMYVIEGTENGFDSIPRGVYWAIVTVTTVGYGDIAPSTAAGQVIASAAMVIGYSLIIIPTGIFASELVRVSRHQITTQSCPSCIREGHDDDALYCKYCGAKL